jgi:hypothetical protein
METMDCKNWPLASDEELFGLINRKGRCLNMKNIVFHNTPTLGPSIGVHFGVELCRNSTLAAGKICKTAYLIQQALERNQLVIT